MIARTSSWAAAPSAVCRSCASELAPLIAGQLMAESADRCAGVLLDIGRLVDALVPVVAEDLHALVAGDPAARGSCRYVLSSYKCFRAVLAYRVAHALVELTAGMPATGAEALRISARCVSERAKVQTGIEIHPEAVIGRRFVIDHGIGTVIGQTVAIGDDCYILQSVILGSTGIAGNSAGRRHPTLGHRVEVGAFARVLGAVRIGDDALIGPHCVVTSNVPSGTRVVLRNQYQILSSGCELQVFGAVPRIGGGFEIHGAGLSEVSVTVVDRELRSHARPEVVVERATDRLLECSLRGLDGEEPRLQRDAGLLLTDRSREWLAVMTTVVLRPPRRTPEAARSA